MEDLTLQELLVELRNQYYTLDHAFSILLGRYDFYDHDSAKKILASYRASYKDLVKHCNSLLALMNPECLNFKEFCSNIDCPQSTIDNQDYSFNKALADTLNEFKVSGNFFNKPLYINYNKDSNAPRNIWALLLYLETTLECPIILLSNLDSKYIINCFLLMKNEINKLKDLYPSSSFRNVFVGKESNDALAEILKTFKNEFGPDIGLIDYYCSNPEVYTAAGVTKVLKLKNAPLIL